MSNQLKYETLVMKYPVFHYDSYHIEEHEDRVEISFEFRIEGLCKFRPKTTIPITEVQKMNGVDTNVANKMVFNIGMIELISYWKCTCSPVVKVHCGKLDEKDILWWKKLYYHGLGEFFYLNGITVTMDDFMTLEFDGDDFEVATNEEVFISETNLIPIGGGKDSIVTMELLSQIKDKNYCLIINPRGASYDSAITAGYTDDRIIAVNRVLDKKIIELNAEGYLNGHTPFSAMLAFVSTFVAYLYGAKYILLSNESSANESTVIGSDVNHQYSKSFEFENDFRSYVTKNLTDKIEYLSILRPFNEIQIAKFFSLFPKYYSVFKSCNVGSKKDIWCGKCAKCLFVYIIMAPFIEEEKLVKIFGTNMLDDKDMIGIFDELVGFKDVKPFECVGTLDDVRYSLNKLIQKYKEKGKLPALLDYYVQRSDFGLNVDYDLLKYKNDAHNVPDIYEPFIMRMYNDVTKTD